MVISCNTFGVATSPNVADLSTSLNAGQWNDSKHVVLPIIIRHDSTVSGEDYVESTHRASAEKNLGRGRFSNFSRSVKIA